MRHPRLSRSSKPFPTPADTVNRAVVWRRGPQILTPVARRRHESADRPCSHGAHYAVRPLQPRAVLHGDPASRRWSISICSSNSLTLGITTAPSPGISNDLRTNFWSTTAASHWSADSAAGGIPLDFRALFNQAPIPRPPSTESRSEESARCIRAKAAATTKNSGTSWILWRSGGMLTRSAPDRLSSADSLARDRSGERDRPLEQPRRSASGAVHRW